MLPANQRFGANDFSGTHIDLGLIVKNKLAFDQGPADVIEAFVMPANTAILLSIKNVVTVFPAQLGLIHRLIGLTQQLIGINIFRLRIKSNAQTGRNLKTKIANMDRLRSGSEQTGQHPYAVGNIGQIRQNGNKLVAPDARDGVTFAQGLLHAPRQRKQQLIADRMPIAVVNRLEPVEIQIDHCQQVPTPLRLHHGLIQTIGKQHAVWQCRQYIIVRERLQLPLILLE